jgi:D-alanyl-D-alanine carboxypeptidase
VCMGLPGISIAVVSDSGAEWSGADGWASIQHRTEMTTEHRLCIGSITKTFVATVILQLVEEGKLDLSKTATAYIREPATLALVQEVPNADEASLSDLLSHQSGVPSWEFEPEWIRAARGAAINAAVPFPPTGSLMYATAGA